jgi:hypothetical protein
MNLLNFFKKIGRLRDKHLSGKNAALFLLNRKIPGLAGGRKEFGKITDIRLERPTKTIAFEITKDNRVNTITVRGYHIAAHRGDSCLGWNSMEFAGPDRARYGEIFQDIERIKISKNSIFLLEAVL